MPVEAAAIGVVASVSNAFITLWKHGLHYAEIPQEVEQFRLAIENLQSSINTSRRLRRVKSRYLDSATKVEVDEAIKRSESVLESISRTVEGCRADLQTKGTVSAKRRLEWIFSGHDQFMARGLTLNSSLQVLSMQINRMDSMQPPEPAHTPDPPSYKDSLLPEQTLRAPSTRKRSSQLTGRASLSNMSMFSFSTAKEATVSQAPSADTASMYSYDESLSGTLSSVPDLSCSGDYCTNELCPNHESDMSGLPVGVSVDGGAHQRRSSQSLFIPATALPTDLLSQPSQRRRNKSGLI